MPWPDFKSGCYQNIQLNAIVVTSGDMSALTHIPLKEKKLNVVHISASMVTNNHQCALIFT